jgi:hypothetical protein
MCVLKCPKKGVKVMLKYLVLQQIKHWDILVSAIKEGLIKGLSKNLEVAVDGLLLKRSWHCRFARLCMYQFSR